MTELLPPVERGRYVHWTVRIDQAVQAGLNGQAIEPMTRREFMEQQTRDVGADPNEGIADVWLDEEADLVTMVLDPKTAAVVMYAARLMASDMEAHSREVLDVAGKLPEGSYGRQNREEIASRRGRVARRLRVLERAYQDVIDKEFWGI